MKFAQKNTDLPNCVFCYNVAIKHGLSSLFLTRGAVHPAQLVSQQNASGRRVHVAQEDERVIY